MARSHDLDFINALRRWHHIEHSGNFRTVGAVDPGASKLYDAISTVAEYYDDVDEAADQYGHDSDEFAERASLLAGATKDLFEIIASSRGIRAGVAQAASETFAASADEVTQGFEIGAAAAASFALPSSLGDNIPVTVGPDGTIRPLGGGGGGGYPQQGYAQPGYAPQGYAQPQPPPGGYRVDLRSPAQQPRQIVVQRPAQQQPQQQIIVRKKKKGLFSRKNKPKIIVLQK